MSKSFTQFQQICGGMIGLLLMGLPVATAQYYYPQQPGYPPGYYPQYPQYPQQQRRPQQPRRGQPSQQPRHSDSGAPDYPTGSQPRKARTPKDTSGDAPPRADVSALEAGPLIAYTWDDRDTLADLARTAGISPNQVLALNNLSLSQLRSGQVLRLPPLDETTTGNLDIAPAPDAQLAREIWRGIRGKKRVALTFDAGGVTDGLETLLSNLKSRNAAATFFATGEFTRDHPAAVQSIADAGYPVHNHSWSHPEFTKISDDEIRTQLSRAEDAISSVTGHSTKPLWRPPFGDRDDRVLKTAAAAGYQSIYWTHDSLDSVDEKKSAEFVADRVLHPPRAKANPDSYLDGAIILMHVGEEGTAAAIPQIIDDLRARGFTLVSVEEILKP